MLRRILLGSIMAVAIAIIVVALQQFQQKEKARKESRPDKGPLVARAGGGIELRKYDKQNNLVAIIRGRQAQQISEKGPVDIIKPVVTIFRDKNEFTVITADNGSVAGREQDKMQEGWVKGNVVMTVIDRKAEDNTIITCDEIRFFGDKGQIVIPGQVKARNRTLDLTGVSMVSDQTKGVVTIERDVALTIKEVSGGSFDQAAGAAPATPAGPPKPIVITCEGSLVFESELHSATFQREVHAVQGDNRVRADRMRVDFEPQGSTAEPAGDVPVADGTTPAPPKPAGLSVRRVVMTSDRKEGVIVEGPNRQGWGEQFEYDARDGSFVYSGSPCRAVQKSANQTFQLEGSEIRFGRKRLLGQAEALPAGMTENSQKVLLTGKPARVTSIPADQGEPMALSGDRVLFDQDARVAWLEGAVDRHAVASQGKNRIEGVSVLLAQKTETRGERASAKGPGKLETASAAKADGREGAPSVVEFGGDMTYRPDEQAADFTGGVRFSDGVTVCNSKSLAVEFAEGKKSGSREIRRVTATGDVVVTGDKMDAKSDVLVYGYPPGEALSTATLTAKAGESCEVRQGDLYCRAERIDMTETSPAAPGGKSGMRAKALGAGYIKYQPAPKEGATSAQPFEVRFTRSGVYDDAKLRAVFDGDVKLTRSEMDLSGQQVVMTLRRKETTPDASGKASTSLEVAGIDAADNVTLMQGKPGSRLTATGSRLEWDRVKQTAMLAGGDGAPARVLQDRTDFTAPRMDAKLKDDAFERIITTGGGRMIGYTQSSMSGKATKIDPETGKPALQRMDVTWDGEGFYQTLETQDPEKDPTAFMRVKGNAKAVTEDSDCTGDSLMVYMGPPRGAAPDSKSLRLEVRSALAVGNARAKGFDPDSNNYRFARGDTLEWDRLTNRMVISSEKGDAVVWDNSNEWVGRQLVVNRTPEGKMEADSTSGRRIIFYEEGTPKRPGDDGKEWKPIY